jgi:hypothetical protein
MPDVKILRRGWTFISIVKIRFKVSQNQNSSYEIKCSLPNGIEITANNSQRITKLYSWNRLLNPRVYSQLEIPEDRTIVPDRNNIFLFLSLMNCRRKFGHLMMIYYLWGNKILYHECYLLFENTYLSQIYHYFGVKI